MNPRTPPNSPESEIGILGSIMLRSKSFFKIADMLQPGDFYSSAHRHIYAAIVELMSNGDPVDPVTVEEVLKSRKQLESVGGIEFLISLSGAIPTSYNIVAYAKQVLKSSQIRQAIEISFETIDVLYQSSADPMAIISDTQSSLLQIQQEGNGPRNKLEKADALPVFDRFVEEITQPKEKGIRTGFYEYDDIAGDILPGKVTVIAARPSMGKSAFALNIANNLIKRKLPVLFLDMENSRESLLRRFCLLNGQIPRQALRNPVEANKVRERLQSCEGLPLWIADGYPTLAVIRNQINEVCIKEGKPPAVVIVDFLQLITPHNLRIPREQQISAISRELKKLAKEFGTHIIELSQLNRMIETREIDNRTPRLSDFRESGAIEQDADLACGIFRPQFYYELENKTAPAECIGKAFFNVMKNRDGRCGNFELRFRGPILRFESMANIQHDDDNDPYGKEKQTSWT